MKTVKDLIAELSELDQDLVVGMSSDEEGNSTHDYCEFTFAVYNEKRGWGEQYAGYVYDDDDNEIEVTEETATAIVLWP